MNAFPTNSKNNTIGGSGPINDGITLEQFHGLTTEGFQDYAKTGYEPKPFSAVNTAIVNPVQRVEPVHGEETMGLGTSTFLEGAPASRQAIQRTKSDQPEGLMRKKSLAMRIRGMSQSKRFTSGATITLPPLSPELSKGLFQDRSAGVALTDGPAQPTSPTSPRPGTSNSNEEKSPVKAVSKHDEEYEKKGASIKAAEEEMERSGGRERAMSSPRKGVFERTSTDNTEVAAVEKSGGGFLSRVKSLKGPKRVKSERHPS
jgi:Pal1 cell morphology protein